MTDHVQYLTVALDKDYQVDDVESIVNALKMVKGVQDVTLGEPKDMGTYLATSSFRQEAYAALFDVLYLAAFKADKFKAIALQAKLAKDAG